MDEPLNTCSDCQHIYKSGSKFCCDIKCKPIPQTRTCKHYKWYNPEDLKELDKEYHFIIR